MDYILALLEKVNHDNIKNNLKNFVAIVTCASFKLRRNFMND